MKIVIALLIDECTENVEEVKIAKIILAENENNHNVILVQRILC